MTRLYIGNIPFTSTEYDIRDLFSTLGEVGRVDMVIDRETGRSRGFAFIDIADEAAGAALALAGTDFGGRKLVVNAARERGYRSNYNRDQYDH